MLSDQMPKPESIESLQSKVLEIAQRISQKWKDIPKRDDQVWQAEDPHFAAIYNQGSKEAGGKTGIQVFFESRMKEIELQSQNNQNLRFEMLGRLVIELEKYEKHADEIIRDYKS